MNMGPAPCRRPLVLFEVRAPLVFVAGEGVGAYVGEAPGEAQQAYPAHHHDVLHVVLIRRPWNMAHTSHSMMVV